MINFTCLENVRQMDFSQLRGLPTGNNDARATDEAILYLVNNLKYFFEQFKSPSSDDLNQYQTYMREILINASLAEHAYYLKKYCHLGGEQSLKMAEGSKINSPKQFTQRMQYWAAGESFGDTIRNPESHVYVVNQISKLSNGINRMAFFPMAQNTQDADNQSLSALSIARG